jgi:hypothetical protein
MEQVQLELRIFTPLSLWTEDIKILYRNEQHYIACIRVCGIYAKFKEM